MCDACDSGFQCLISNDCISNLCDRRVCVDLPPTGSLDANREDNVADSGSNPPPPPTPEGAKSFGDISERPEAKSSAENVGASALFSLFLIVSAFFGGSLLL